MENQTTLKAVLWAANAVAWGCVFAIDRSSKARQRRSNPVSVGEIAIDLDGPKPLQVVYQKKMIPEFTIYQV